jgi:hypothetical protein
MRVRALVLSLIGFMHFLTMPFSTISAGADQRNPTVVVDSSWSGDYAKSGCEQAKSFMNDETESLIRNFGCGAVAACPEVMARLVACTSGADPKTQAYQFEDRLMTQFAINPSCKGAAFARDSGPDGMTRSAAEEAIMSRPHWELSIDFVVGSPTQAWSLQYLGEENVLQGESATEAKVASDVCAIVLGHGGTPAR